MRTTGLPYYTAGYIVKGFGRGSKELGCPTANFSIDAVRNLPVEIKTGIYFGWASVDNGDVHKMVMSIGMNPFYDNKERSMETHILHNFNKDLYGQILKVCISGFIRPEQNFDSLDSLKQTIQQDIEYAKERLDLPQYRLRNTYFFTSHIV